MSPSSRRASIKRVNMLSCEARVLSPSSRMANKMFWPMSVVVVDMIRPTAPTIIKAAPSLIRWSFSRPLSAIKYAPAAIMDRYMYNCLRIVCLRTPPPTRRSECPRAACWLPLFSFMPGARPIQYINPIIFQKFTVLYGTAGGGSASACVGAGPVKASVARNGRRRPARRPSIGGQIGRQVGPRGAAGKHASMALLIPSRAAPRGIGSRPLPPSPSPASRARGGVCSGTG